MSTVCFHLCTTKDDVFCLQFSNRSFDSWFPRNNTQFHEQSKSYYEILTKKTNEQKRETKMEEKTWKEIIE